MGTDAQPYRPARAGLGTRTIAGLTAGLALAFLLPATTVAQGSEPNVPDEPDVVVDDDLKCPGAEHSTINAGVVAAASGETVKVCAGTYNEQVIIAKPLELLGVQADNDARERSPDAPESIIDGQGAPAGGGLAIQASGVIVDGFTVRNVGGPPPGFGAGIWVSAATGGHSIRNTILRGNTIGISLNNSADADPEQTVLQHNLFDMNIKGGSASGNGVYSEQMSNVLIDENRFTGHTNSAMVINAATPGPSTPQPPDPPQPPAEFAGSGIRITGNDIVDDSEILVFESSDVTISGNRVIRPSESGIVLGGGNANVDVIGNTVENPGDGGAGVELLDGMNDPPTPRGPNTGVRIIGNTLLGGGDEAGIRLAAPSTDGGGVPATGEVEVHLNRIAGNETGLAVETVGATVDAQNNWWGCNGGPAVAACDPTSATVPNAITSDPWLVLTATAPASAVAGGAPVTVAADLNQNSAGTAPGPYELNPTDKVDFPATPLRFTTSLGSIAASVPTVAGRLETPLTPGDVAGASTVTAVLDGETRSMTVEILDQTPPDASVAPAPEGHASSAGRPKLRVPDDTPPNTSLRDDLRKVKTPLAQFRFASTEPASSFECRLDGGRFRPCGSPTTLNGLKPGKHLFEVRAIDVAANVDPTPAYDRFTVKRKPRQK
jgi:parallel beta-helix repeat protein